MGIRAARSGLPRVPQHPNVARPLSVIGGRSEAAFRAGADRRGSDRAAGGAAGHGCSGGV
jgi:hypothetical protein